MLPGSTMFDRSSQCSLSHGKKDGSAASRYSCLGVSIQEWGHQRDFRPSLTYKEEHELFQGEASYLIKGACDLNPTSSKGSRYDITEVVWTTTLVRTLCVYNRDTYEMVLVERSNVIPFTPCRECLVATWRVYWIKKRWVKCWEFLSYPRREIMWARCSVLGLTGTVPWGTKKGGHVLPINQSSGFERRSMPHHLWMWIGSNGTSGA